MVLNPYIECGKIVNTHGCFGAVKAESWCNTPKEMAGLRHVYLKKGDTYTEYNVLKASVFKQFVILTLDTVNTMDFALSLKGQTVYAKRKDFHLEKGEYFIADLIGLPVIDADTDQIYGTLSETINRGASDIYVVHTENGETMIPAVPEFIDRVEIEKGIFVRPIAGMFD